MTPLEEAKQKLEVLVKKQEMMKGANKIVASKSSDADKIEKLKEIGFSEQSAKEVLKPDFANRIGFPSYTLTNNNAKINTQKAKVLTLEASAEKEEIKEQIGETGYKTYVFDGGTFVVEPDRVRIYYDDKPSDADREKLKREGWKWSYANKAWQRFVTDASILSAQRLTGGKLDQATAPEIEYKSFQVAENAAENFEKKKFTYLTVYFNRVQKHLGIQSSNTSINLVVFTHSAVEAKELLSTWLKTQMPEELANMVTFYTYPQKYIREAKRLYDRKMFLPNPGLSLFGQFPQLQLPNFDLQSSMDFNAVEETNVDFEIDEPKESEPQTKFIIDGAEYDLSNESFPEDHPIMILDHDSRQWKEAVKEHFAAKQKPISEFQQELERQKSLGIVDKDSPAISILGMMSGKNNPVAQLQKSEEIKQSPIDVSQLIKEGKIELELEATNSLHAKQYGLEATNPLYLKRLCVHEDYRLLGIGKLVLAYIDDFALQNKHDVVFGHVTQKSQFTKKPTDSYFCDVDMIKNWLQSNGYSINNENNDFHKVFTQNISQESIAPQSIKINLNPSSYKNQFLLNEAIRQYIEENALTIDNCLQRTYTEEEKQFLRSYTGYGGLGQFDKEGKADVLRIMEFYTPNKIIEIMWGLAYKNGYKANQSVFEPSAGTGEFLKYTNPETVVEAVEISKISSVICQILYPHVHVNNAPFEEMFIAKNFTIKDKIFRKYDLVIGNPPYASFERLEPEAAKYLLGMGEKDYTKARNYVEYFLRRSVDLLNPGGLLVFIIGAEVMNGGQLFLDSDNSPVKKYLHEHTQLLEAYRLPAGVFDNTNVTSEILVLKKL